jgi:hypothetical protein
MPFRSKAQMRKFYSDPRLRKYAKKWSRHTRSTKRLPERARRRRRR